MKISIIKPALALTTNIREVIEEPGDDMFFKFTNIGQMISRIVTVSLSISAILVLMFMIWGAVDLISSQGDKQQLEGARNKITYALIGLAIVAVAWAAWKVILQFFGIGIIGDEGGVVLSPE